MVETGENVSDPLLGGREKERGIMEAKDRKENKFIKECRQKWWIKIE